MKNKIIAATLVAVVSFTVYFFILKDKETNQNKHQEIKPQQEVLLKKPVTDEKLDFKIRININNEDTYFIGDMSDDDVKILATKSEKNMVKRLSNGFDSEKVSALFLDSFEHDKFKIDDYTNNIVQIYKDGKMIKEFMFNPNIVISEKQTSSDNNKLYKSKIVFINNTGKEIKNTIFSSWDEDVFFLIPEYDTDLFKQTMKTIALLNIKQGLEENQLKLIPEKNLIKDVAKDPFNSTRSILLSREINVNYDGLNTDKENISACELKDIKGKVVYPVSSTCLYDNDVNNFFPSNELYENEEKITHYINFYKDHSAFKEYLNSNIAKSVLIHYDQE